jgi:hypothetical protein
MNNKKTEIIQTIKTNYNRDLRKQVVKTIQEEEKKDTEPNYDVINQILSYIIKELDWKAVKDTQSWDHTPLDIVEETFPKIKTTIWFKIQVDTIKQMIDIANKS